MDKSILREKLNFYVMLIVTGTLSIVILSMVIVMLSGLFSSKVDNSEIFKLIGPAFQTITGGFIGILAGIKIGSNSKNNKQ